MSRPIKTKPIRRLLHGAHHCQWPLCEQYRSYALTWGTPLANWTRFGNMLVRTVYACETHSLMDRDAWEGAREGRS